MKIYIDEEAPLMSEIVAVIQTTATQRKRFPENIVHPCRDAAEALQRAQEDSRLRAAWVIGPSRSSEGFRLYYLVRWLS